MLRVLLPAVVVLSLACDEKPPAPAAAPAATPADAPAAAEAAAPKPAPVRSAMWSMASKTNRLAELLAQPALAPEGLAEAKTIVDDVAKIAAGLAADPLAQKHPLIKGGLADFTASVTAAQAGLAKDPVDTGPAAALGASCKQCHAQGKSAPPFSL